MKNMERNNQFNGNILKIIFEYHAGGIIIGLPINNNGKLNKMSQFIKDISKNLDFFLKKENFDIPILFWDESFSSIEAEILTDTFFKNKKSQKKTLDKFAAKVILEDFINYKH